MWTRLQCNHNYWRWPLLVSEFTSQMTSWQSSVWGNVFVEARAFRTVRLENDEWAMSPISKIDLLALPSYPLSGQKGSARGKLNKNIKGSVQWQEMKTSHATWLKCKLVMIFTSFWVFEPRTCAPVWGIGSLCRPRELVCNVIADYWDDLNWWVSLPFTIAR